MAPDSRKKNAWVHLAAIPLVMALGMSDALSSGLPRAVPEELGISSARLALLTTVLNRHVDEGRVAGYVAAVARHGRVVYLESAGWQDIESGSRMREDSIFQIRSMSKPIVSLAIMQLLEAGQLDLQDPVSRYVPSFADMQVFTDPADFASPTRAPTREVTIEDLLLHTGGLSHRNGALYRAREVRSRADTLEQLVEKVAAVPLVSDPGTAWTYSISTTVLGRIVEIISGQRLDDYLRQSILEPLDMPDTGFYVPAGKTGRLARIYQVNQQSGSLVHIPDMEIPITENPPLLEGAAGMVSTVPDYLRFLQAFLNTGELDGQRVLSPQGVQAMTSNRLPDAVMPIGFNPASPMRESGWGYGFNVIIDKVHSAHGVNNGEFGWNGSLGTFSWADPETGTIAILMMQVQPAGAWNLSSQFKALVYQSIVD